MDPGIVTDRTMKAVRIHAYGGPEVVQYEDAPAPLIGPDEILVQVAAAGVNPADWRIRNGQFQAMRPVQFPLTLGLDVAGLVDSVGEDVVSIAPGDAIIARAEGAFAEYVVVRAPNVAAAPSKLPLEFGAAIPVAAGSASLLVSRIGPVEGKTILVQGAAGGVGGFVVQIAKLAGARVIGTASGANADHVRGLGADEVVDYQIGSLTHLDGQIDVVVDLVGPKAQAKSWPLLREGGRLFSLASPPDQLLARAHNVTAMFGRGDGEIDGPLLENIAYLVDSGKLHVSVGNMLPLSQAASAMQASEKGHGRGKTLLSVEMFG
ncbi:MAG: NADP-dependent oxidoreductase [Sphingosinicella sp.]|nr:NADP-dependent oxidoreductase [Sphingosinicella sp.]